MRIPKKYGQSKIDKCPFCQRHATAMNSQKVPVCQLHKDDALDNIKCICGLELEALNGKFGTFFSCLKCGSMSMKKALEFNAANPKIKNENFSQKNQKTGREITVRSDDPRYFD
jgi:hypothetical protein